MKALPSYPNPALRGLRLPAGLPAPTLWYRFCRLLTLTTFLAMWRARAFNRHHEPASGSALYISNHQSFLDPLLIGMCLKRPMNYMARDTLFRMPGFGPLIRSVNAFPVKRGTADTGALKEAIRRLRAGGQLTIFPEGTRTRDGRIGDFLPGVALLAQRAADWVVPTVVDGAFECWPRTSPLPLPGQVTVVYGKPLAAKDIRGMDGAKLLAEIRNTMIALQADLRARRGKEPFTY
jgi:1-acyl-sn-glycerol-3-phosphate acyltransferase